MGQTFQKVVSKGREVTFEEKWTWCNDRPKGRQNSQKLKRPRKVISQELYRGLRLSDKGPKREQINTKVRISYLNESLKLGVESIEDTSAKKKFENQTIKDGLGRVREIYVGVVGAQSSFVSFVDAVELWIVDPRKSASTTRHTSVGIGV